MRHRPGAVFAATQQQTISIDATISCMLNFGGFTTAVTLLLLQLYLYQYMIWKFKLTLISATNVDMLVCEKFAPI